MRFLRHRAMVLLVLAGITVVVAGGWVRYLDIAQQEQWAVELRQSLRQQIESLLASGSAHPQVNSDGTLTYRNEEWGFEFHYPADWTVTENAFKSASSRFNVVVAPSGDQYVPRPIRASVLPIDWIENAERSFAAQGVPPIEVHVAGLDVVAYRHFDDGLPQLDYLVPLDEDHFLAVGGKVRYESILDDVVKTLSIFEGSPST